MSTRQMNTPTKSGQIIFKIFRSRDIKQVTECIVITTSYLSHCYSNTSIYGTGFVFLFNKISSFFRSYKVCGKLFIYQKRFKSSFLNVHSGMVSISPKLTEYQGLKSES